MALARLSDYLIPLLLAGAAVYALGRRVDVFSALTTGAGEGLRIVLRILPPLVALLTAVYMLRASGTPQHAGGVPYREKKRGILPCL